MAKTTPPTTCSQVWYFSCTRANPCSMIITIRNSFWLFRHYIQIAKA